MFSVEVQEWIVRLIVGVLVLKIFGRGFQMLRIAVAGHLAAWHLKSGRVGKAMYWRKLSGYPRVERNV